MLGLIVEHITLIEPTWLLQKSRKPGKRGIHESKSLLKAAKTGLVYTLSKGTHSFRAIFRVLQQPRSFATRKNSWLTLHIAIEIQQKVLYSSLYVLTLLLCEVS
jgi:hypothetical protein